ASFDLSMKVMPLLFEANGYEYVQQATLKKSSDRSIEGQNPLGEKAISQSKALFSKNATVHNRELAQDNNELDTLVGNRVAGRAGELVVMSGVSDSPKLTVGCKIKIQGAGTASLSSDRTDYGIYIVTAVQHNMDGLGSYRNNFKAIPADLKVPPYNSNVRIPTIDTQMATVMDNKDPDGMGRIKVHLQWQKDGDTTDWIRYAAAHAGKDRGFYMLPEVDDEVIVAFENGNVSMPFALSSMYHGKAHSGDRKEDDNNTKAIRTKSGNEIYFNDKGGEEAIHIYTKDKKNEVLITMKDDGLIQITSNKMIKVEAKEDIEVKAKNMKFSAQEKIEFSAKEFKVDAQQLIEMNSTKDFKQKGLDVTVEATKGYKMNANATAELKANATMEISGNAKTTVKATGQLELSAAAQASLKAGIVMIN
ncbi:MAG: phage baseplate assembly protein V, partial [Flavobacteriales bacterium]